MKKGKRKFISWRWLLVSILIALLILALYLLLREYGDLTYAVARYKAETTHHIQGLEETVNALKTANSALLADNVDLTQQVQELTVKINGQVVTQAPTPAPTQVPTVVNVPSGLDTPTNLFTPATALPIVITTLVTAFNGLRLLLPALP